MNLRLILEVGLRQVLVCRWFIPEKTRPQPDPAGHAAGSSGVYIPSQRKLRWELDFQISALSVKSLVEGYWGRGVGGIICRHSRLCSRSSRASSGQGCRSEH